MTSVIQRSRSVTALFISLLFLVCGYASGGLHDSHHPILSSLAMLLEAPCALPLLIASWIFPNKHSAAAAVNAMLLCLLLNWLLIWLIITGLVSWQLGRRKSRKN